MVRLRNILTLIEQEANEPSHFGGGENIKIYDYNTEHFDICKSAVMLFEKIRNAFSFPVLYYSPV